jgi:hypothetical protein
MAAFQNLIRRGTSLSIALALVILAGGCGEKTPRPKEYPGLVTGVVTLDGKPLGTGTITFIPDVAETEGGRPGLARIETDGSFWVGSANTTKPAGLLPGKYRVTVLAMKPDPTGTGKPIAVPIVPERYTEVDSTPFVDIEVQEGKNHFSFDLQSEAATAPAAN